MLGNDAMQFLKTLHNLDEIWNYHDDSEYNDRQLTQFAERYHEHKLDIPDVSKQRELLIAYEIEAAKPYPYDIELIESKVDKYLLSAE